MIANLLPGVPLVESPFFNSFADQLWTGEVLRIAKDLNNYGYAILRLSDFGFSGKMGSICADLKNHFDWGAWEKSEVESLRVQDAWQFNDACKNLATNEQIIAILSALYGKKAFPFQTLNFAVSSEQSAHSDYIHFSSLPEKFMCGVWVAFEDVDKDNGPLFYYPGSHKWPSYVNEHLGISGFNIGSSYGHYHKYIELWDSLAESHCIEKQLFLAKAGDVFIWSSNLVHGGSKMLDRKRTRWSQVTHYFFEGCGYTTPIANDVNQGQIYYRDVVNISTGNPVKNIISGYDVGSELIKQLIPPCITGATIPADFSVDKYLEFNPDVLLAGIDPTKHYLNFGKLEGRRFK